MNCMLDIVWVLPSFEEREENEKKNQNEICLHLESNQWPLAFQPSALDNSSTLTVVEMCFRLLHYLGKWIKSTHVTIMKAMDPHLSIFLL